MGLQMQDFTTNHAYNLRMVYLKLLQPFNDWLAAHPEESPEQVGKPAPPPKVKEEQWLPPKKRVKSEAIAKMEENDESDEDERVPENIDSLLCEFCKVFIANPPFCPASLLLHTSFH
jgi:hypothetical protein